MPRCDVSKRGKHVWRALSNIKQTVIKITTNESILVCKECIKNNFKEKNNFFSYMWQQ
jgi:hypothetical protein